MEYRENIRASEIAASNYGQVLAVCTLVLFFVTQNIGVVFFQLRQASVGNMGAVILGYTAGIALSALVTDLLLPVGRLGKHSVARRLGVLLMVLLPGLFCLLSFQYMPYSGLLRVNIFQLFIWGFSLPPALRFFFPHVPPGRQPLFVGLAMGAGHLCWALLMPLVGGGEAAAPTLTDSLENRFLPFLNIARALTNTAFAVLVWKLSGLEAQGCGYRAALCTGSGLPEKSPYRQLLCLLLPMGMFFVLNGWLGYLFFARLQARGEYMEYMHLGLVLFFPVAGLLLQRKGPDLLLHLLAAALLCLAGVVMVFFWTDQPKAVRLLYLTCIVGVQILYFVGVLAMSLFAFRTRWPSLVLCLPWIVVVGAVVGNILARQLQPDLDVPFSAPTVCLAALCAASPLLLRLVYPLPTLPEESLAQTATDKLAAFAAAFALSPREIQVLEGIVQQLTPEQIREKLGISESTVRFHQTGLFRKTGQINRRQLALFFGVWEWGAQAGTSSFLGDKG